MGIVPNHSTVFSGNINEVVMAQLNITILGQQYRIGCPDGEQKNLLQSVAQVDEHLTDMRASGRTLRNEQLIVMAALNYRHQLNTLQAESQATTDKLNEKIQQLQHAISGVLDKNPQIEKPNLDLNATKSVTSEPIKQAPTQSVIKSSEVPPE